MSEPSEPEFPLVIGAGASAGGVEALATFVNALPPDLRAPLLVVLHIAPSGTSVLPQILARRTRLSVAAAQDGEPLRRGHIHVAPPDQHMTVREGRIALDRGPRINGHRPAVDPMLRSLAENYGPRAAGVILSGTRDDGTLGLAAIKAAGGRAYVQDPDEALYPWMAESAAREVELDGSMPVAELALTLAALTREAPAMAGAGGLAVGAALDDGDGAPTQLTCPDCGGVLHEHTGGGVLRYACHVGHVFAPESLDEAQARQLESALWAAVRTLDDRAALLDRMADRSDGLGHARVAETHRREAADCRRRADLIREVVAQSRPAA